LSLPGPPEVELPNSDSVELTLGAAGAGGTTGAGAAIAGRGARFGFAGRGAAAFLPAFFLGAALFATFLAVFFLAAFLFGAALRRADFLATFLRVTFDFVLTRAFLDLAAFFFARFFDAFFAAMVFTPPVGPVCRRANPIPRSRELKTLARVSAS
jgi:hypothetical protein